MSKIGATEARRDRAEQSEMTKRKDDIRTLVVTDDYAQVRGLLNLEGVGYELGAVIEHFLINNLTVLDNDLLLRLVTCRDPLSDEDLAKAGLAIIAFKEPYKLGDFDTIVYADAQECARLGVPTETGAHTRKTLEEWYQQRVAEYEKLTGDTWLTPATTQAATTEAD
jgi:hypothetical protein